MYRQDDYYQKYGDQFRNLKVEDVRMLSSKIVDPEKLSFFVVGDKATILPGLQELGYEIIQVDADGNPVENKQLQP